MRFNHLLFDFDYTLADSSAGVIDCVRYALNRLEAAGAVVTTWEALVYEWMRGAEHPAFKRVLGLVKGG